jgi:hypothetical protein
VKPETITPKEATALLKLNKRNRPLSKGVVNRYVEDMKGGRWKFNGSTILISKSGILLDGQHRLAACIQADVPFQALVVRDLDDDVMATVDAGKKRSAGDALALYGFAEGYAPAVAAAGRLVLNYVHKRSLNSSCTASETVDLISRFSEVAEYAIMAHPAHKIIQSSTLGSVLFLGTRARGFTRHAHAFVEAIVHGAELRADDPRLALRNYFLNSRARNPGGRAPLTHVSFLAVIRGWNAFVRQEPLTQIRPFSGREKIVTPDIIGGPKCGDGVDALSSVKLHTNQIKAMKDREAAEREKLSA